MEPDLEQFITDELRADTVAWPIIEKMPEKDVAGIMKSYAHGQHRLGNSIPLPSKDAKPEELEGIRKRVYEAGLFTAPPGSPADYGITKPDNLADGVTWSDDLAGELGTVLHKHGATKELAGDLLSLYGKALGGAQEGLKVDGEASIAALKQEHGDKYEERREMVKRMTASIFKTPEEVAWFENTKAGEVKEFLSVMMRLAPLAASDSSYAPGQSHGDGTITLDQVREEVSAIMSDKNNPKHEGYWRRDKGVMDHIDGLYKRAAGSGTVEIT